MPIATDFKDYYSILGVNKTATPEEIKRAYRKIARKHHPDLNPDDKDAEAKFKDLNEANEVLSDPEKREKYDRFGQQWNQPNYNEAPPPKETDAGNNFEQYGDFDSFINDLLGRSQRRDSSSGFRSQSPAPDTEAAIVLTFSEAFHGVQKRLQLDEDTINVRIPAGAKPSSRIRLKGKGRASPFSHQRGDLYLTIELVPHSFFRFEDDRLVCDIPIRPDEAVLGTEIKVPTPDGIVTMKVPKGLKSGQSLRLRGKGWTLQKGGRGDLFAKLQVVTPQDLNAIEQECYEKIQANTSFNPRAYLEEIKEEIKL
ncbi:DnaJ-class molecular chaperone CbpA [Pseudanabaena sp. lw0831]|uniref:DnaJ C-terminal domain-containing protein n=1 Tax=Pseudanabaena sp. lw0831 TaxID=1357935 RepID=UPI001915E7FA|nr:DnaJ C-terminal domain-containing protein [Pseudanabaena sp. lw0831]GBO56182.1 DnaJ-class molecular chaperone CbpA [Pseudanabaena sp. lw0831]